MFGKKSPPDQSSATPDNNEIAAALKGVHRHNADNTRILASVASEYLKDRKSRRRWGYFFKCLIGLYLGIVLIAWFIGRDTAVGQRHTALVELDGVIAPGGVSADEINESLQRAFKAPQSAGVVMRINSPGGTPVQAAEINAEIRRLKGKYPQKPFYVVIADMCASGGYYVAVAADQIYAHPSSLVGSIGVRMDSFGFVDSLEKLGVERRLITAGKNKGMLDPFSPLQPAQKAHAEAMVAEVHQQFIDTVKAGRGDRLVDDPDLFSGLYWSGERAMELGLVDAYGSVSDIARDVLAADKIVSYNPRRSILDQFAREMGAVLSANLLQSGWQLR